MTEIFIRLKFNKFSDINFNIIKDIRRYIFAERCNIHFKIITEKVSGGGFFYRIYYPVFAHAGKFINIQLFYIIVNGIARRNDFNNPVRSAVAAFIAEFIRIADKRYIGFYVICLIFYV